MDPNITKKAALNINHGAFIDFVRMLFSTHYNNLGDTNFFDENNKFRSFHIRKLIATFSDYLHIYQYYFPHILPLDLLKNSKEIDIRTPFLMEYLKKKEFSFTINPSTWEAMNSSLYFLSNLNDPKYEELLLSKYRTILKDLNKKVDFGIGNINSFFTQEPQITSRTFHEFVRTRLNGLIILFPSHEDPQIMNHFTGRYFESGILNMNSVPIEPILLDSLKNLPAIIKDFEDLLSKNPKETEIEKFIKEHYKLILGYTYDRIQTQVLINPENEKSKGQRYDILLHNIFTDDLKLLELKKIFKVAVGKLSKKHPSYRLTYAITQISKYKELLETKEGRDKLNKKGIDYNNIVFAVSIGRRPQIPIKEWDFLKKIYSKEIKIITYDDLLDDMKSRLKEFRKVWNFRS